MTLSHHLPLSDLQSRVDAVRDEIVAVRRDLHAHPELGWHEVRTTELIRQRLVTAGLSPQVLPTGTGLICDIGAGDTCVALRADIDALPVPDAVDSPFRSTLDRVAHACGHDIHTAALLGAALVLARMAAEGMLNHRVRLVFQPAEEVMPGGALGVIAAGGMEGVRRIYGLHCDPRLPVGQVGLRVGALTAAADRVLVRVTGSGGHTSRPHLTGDLVYALATLVTEMPAALSRRVDPRAGMSLVWGRITAGSAANAIPARGEAEGTLRCLDASAWRLAADLIPTLAEQLIAPYDVEVGTELTHGVPPVMNDAEAIAVLDRAVRQAIGPDAVAPTDQSLGGEDFAWYLEHVPGAMARLGVRPVGVGTAADLHTPGFDPDEDAIAIGMMVLASCALLD
jgi:amidohydrolase